MSVDLDRIVSRFDEAAYLARNPDVEAAVQSGVFASGREHFERFGLMEGRSPCPWARRKLLVGNLDVAAMRGVEIGPLADPVVRKNEGDVLYIDHADTDALIRSYANDRNVDVGRIVTVDAVWGDRRLRECVPAGFIADYVVASHVIEHVPDLLGWMGEVREILSPSGELRLAVPDRRYSFDILRHETRLHDVVEAYVRKPRKPLLGAVIEFLLCYRDVKTVDVWLGRADLDNLPTPFKASEVVEIGRKVLDEQLYIDVHCWVFTPRSFAELMEQAIGIGLLAFECVDFHDTEPLELEFFIGMRATDDLARAARSWRAMRDAAAGPKRAATRVRSRQVQSRKGP